MASVAVDNGKEDKQMNRWARLSAALVAMIMIGNLQYTWTLFVHPMMEGTGWKLSDLQWGFTIYIACMTWLMPISGWFIDRLGPRAFMIMAGVLCAIGWGALGHARSLPEFYLLYALAGCGNGFVYCCSMSMGLKWFADKRGLASGIISAGYGSGAALFIPLFAYLLKDIGYSNTFLYTGVGLGIFIVAAGLFLRNPSAGEAAAPPSTAKVTRVHREDFKSGEMLRTPQFYMLYIIMLMIGIGGLMASAQVAPVGRNFKVGATALAIALSLNPIGNGIGRFGWGWVSDHLGRERTMALAFFLQSLFLVSVVTVGRQSDILFVLTMFFVFVTWGETYVLFPTTQADIFGSRYAAGNYGFLYSSKGLASILAGGTAALLFEKTGTWNYAFYGSAALSLISAVAALGLKKMPLPKKRPIQAPVPAGYQAAAVQD